MATELRDESRMIASILAGDAQLFHELIRPYERRVYAMALSFLRNEADAEDVAQEAFLKAFRSLASFRGDAKFGTWLVSITLNEARSRIRRRDAIKMESLDDAQDDDQGHSSPALLRDWKEIPSEALERKEVRSLLQKAITSLPQIYREVFQLRDIEQLSVNEAAQALGITVSSVKVRLHRARMMLQKNLAPQLKETAPKRRWWAWS
jgi:RNA polymerase sigma-70 factor (ECF subfamily)